jgi:branched-chain amino acid aminotransferase
VEIPSASSILLYGKGVFITIAIRDGKPFLWEKHWRRLTKDIESIGLSHSPLSEIAVLDQLNKSTEMAGICDGRARITVFDETPSSIWQQNVEQKTNFGIITGDLRPMPEAFRVTGSSYNINSRSPLAGIKSCNYLENIMAIEEAKGHGFDEAIRLNESGEITSACMANVFWLKDDVLYTPSLKTGCLPGTTREYVLENLDCREVEARIEDVNKAEAIFLTSAGLGIVEVAEFGSRKMARSGHPIMELWPPRSKTK